MVGEQYSKLSDDEKLIQGMEFIFLTHIEKAMSSKINLSSSTLKEPLLSLKNLSAL